MLLFVATWMKLEGIVPTEISQTQKDKYCMMSLRSGIYKSQVHKRRE